ncbi:unnamed protein product [Prorocentrum cordatum]|uniref:Sulphur transport domain-containing protein n=1 Tax=Prorocentrum cordatum TaxID=2364126 RepID=A0ABN9R0S6_9DINO|nr:unnamed protein product [Polarella glacialis]
MASSALPGGLLGSALRLFVFIAVGIAFGFLFERSHVYEPDAIRKQFSFQRNIMLKMFVGAVGGAALSFYVWERPLLSKSSDIIERVRRFRSGTPLPRAALGGAILGVGMVVGGACPGMVLPQVGTGVHNAHVTLLGGFAGALVHNLWEFAQGWWRRRSQSRVVAASEDGSGDAAAAAEDRERRYRGDFLDLRFNLPFDKCMLGVFFACAAFCLVMELAIDFESDLVPGTKGAWPPSLAGFGIGLVNLVSLGAAGASMGSSKAYAQVMLSGVFQGALKKGVCGSGQRAQSDGGGAKGGASSSVDWFNGALERHWQVPYLCASVLGAFLSNEMAGNASVQGVEHEAIAFIGGFLMLFGSRLGGGCTSGHGIAGMPLLFIPSVAAVSSMFGAGILTALWIDGQQPMQLQGTR